VKTLVAVALALIASSASATEVIQAKPDGGTNTSTFALNQPGYTTGQSGMELFSEGDKQHVFTISPAGITDPSSQNTGANYQGQLSYSQEKSMGIQLGIPFGSIEPDRNGPIGAHPSDAGVMGDFPHGHS
jgi:hypothetical protein